MVGVSIGSKVKVKLEHLRAYGYIGNYEEFEVIGVKTDEYGALYNLEDEQGNYILGVYEADIIEV